MKPHDIGHVLAQNLRSAASERHPYDLFISLLTVSLLIQGLLLGGCAVGAFGVSVRHLVLGR